MFKPVIKDPWFELGVMTQPNENLNLPLQFTVYQIAVVNSMIVSNIFLGNIPIDLCMGNPATLKGIVHPKITHLLTTMPMEEWLSPQNTFGVSQLNSVAAKSNVIEITGDWFLKCEILLLWCHPSVHKPRHSNSTQNSIIYTKFCLKVLRSSSGAAFQRGS